jgi:hypothetical protein
MSFDFEELIVVRLANIFILSSSGDVHYVTNIIVSRGRRVFTSIELFWGSQPRQVAVRNRRLEGYRWSGAETFLETSVSTATWHGWLPEKASTLNLVASKAINRMFLFVNTQKYSSRAYNYVHHLWVVTSCWLVDTYRCFGWTYCLHLQGWAAWSVTLSFAHGLFL